MMGPRISVLTAVHNGERYLEASCVSILAQSFRDFEFLIVDDGSTDRTPEWLERLRREDARVVVIRQKRVGQTRALIRAVQAARGEYLVRHDADDLSLPQRFERQMEYLEAHPAVASWDAPRTRSTSGARSLGRCRCVMAPHRSSRG